MKVTDVLTQKQALKVTYVLTHPGNRCPDICQLQLGLLYGDQWIVVRDLTDEGNGKPIYFSWQWPDEAYTPDGDFDPAPGVYPTGYSAGLESGCVQPVSFEPVIPPPNEQFELVDSSSVHFYDSYGRERVPTYLVPLDPECKIPDVYAETWGEKVMEADSGRFNLARSPQDVLDSAYEEVISICNSAQSFSLDPAGRIVVELNMTDDPDDPHTYYKTIDSPLENLALYQRVMQNGCLVGTGDISLSDESVTRMMNSEISNLVCDEEDDVLLPTSEDLMRAASFLGGAGDKTGRINVDVLIYLNNRLDVNEVIWSPNGQHVIISYFNFQGASYHRGGTHSAATADLLQPPEDDDPSYPAYFDVVEGVSIYEKIFSAEWPDNEGNPVVMDTPIINFVRAADDALAIINYLHNYKLPTDPLLPVSEPIYPIE